MCPGAPPPSVASMNNPTAMITGASRGLGRALAAGLAREGYALIIDARNAAGLDAAADRIRAAGGAVTAIAGDVTDPGHRAALRQAAAVDLYAICADFVGSVNRLLARIRQHDRHAPAPLAA